MVISRISRQGRELAVPLDQFSLELLQQDIDALYTVIVNGIGTDYIEPVFLQDLDSEIMSGTIQPEQEYLSGTVQPESEYLSGSIQPESEYLVGRMEGPT